jgi:hypothetical protein
MIELRSRSVPGRERTGLNDEAPLGLEMMYRNECAHP